MLGDERLYDYVASGLNPTTNGEINSHPDFQGLKGHTTFIKSLDEGNYIPTPMPANFRAGELRSAVISGLEAILLGDVPVSDGVKQIDAAVQRVLDRP
jgi:ABC-type glycerol-3-phosphate transport system substrate-binding protein